MIENILLGIVIGIILTVLLIHFVLLRYFTVVSKEGMENIWNLGAIYGRLDKDDRISEDARKEFEDFYETIKKF